ncbi:MAG: PIN domain-containing protein [Candidatus Woesearchaeota archaeon]
MFKKKTEVILDTNALLLPGKAVDVFTLVHDAMDEPYRLVTHANVLAELERLMQGKKKQSFNAKLGYILAKQKALKTIGRSSAEHTDDAIVEHAKPGKAVVVTQDKALKKRLKEKGVRVLTYHQGKLIFEA